MAALDATALRLITQHGRAIKIRRYSTAGDSGKPWGSSSDTTSYVDYKAVGVFDEAFAADLEARVSTVGRLVKTPTETNMEWIYVPAKNLKVTPSIADCVVDGDRELEIMRVQTVKPGVTTIMYRLEVSA